MILHIPHSSTNIQDYKFKNSTRELERMSDHFTDELYQNKQATNIIFELSRLICDVERFADDAQESMSQFGMGVCYTKDTEGEKLRDFTQKEREEILQNYYYPHHKRLELAVDKELKENGSALIIDCHSFPEEAYHFNSDFGKKRPDICIGTDAFHSPKELVKKIEKYFSAKGYKTSVDNPYSGTMVPLKHYKKDANVHSIMIEINRKLYMDDSYSKNSSFEQLKEEIRVLLNSLE